MTAESPPPGDAEPSRLGTLTGAIARRSTAVVAGVALLAGAWAVLGSQWVFPYLSDDHDEGSYLLQADALADGHLFPPASEHPHAFRPWLSVLSSGRFVLKYTPVHASILATAVRLTGTARGALGLIAAGVVLVTYALAREVLDDRRLAALAAVFLALSPLFVIQSATFLPYCSSLLLLEAFALTLLRGRRSGATWLLAASGLFFGLAVFARPFDAFIFGLPLGGYLVWSRRRQWATLRTEVRWFFVGAALPLLGMFAYFRAATGSPLRSPFNLLEPRDTLGFGTRRLVPGQPGLRFTAAEGIYGVGRYVLMTSFWGFGGLILVGFFLAYMLRHRIRGPEAWIALGGVTFSCGYLFFWGTYGTSLRGSLTSYLGPFYFLPVLLPITLLAAKGFGQLWRRDRIMGAVALAAMLGVSGYLVVKAISVNLRLTADDRRLYAAVAETPLDNAVVLLPPLYGPQLLHPFAWLRNTPDYDGPVLYALDLGDDANLSLLRDHRARRAYRLRVEGRYRANPPDPGLRTELEPLTVVREPSLALDVRLQNPTDDPYVAVSVSVNGRKDSFVLDRRSFRGKQYDTRLTIEPESTVLNDAESHSTEPVDDSGSIVVAIAIGAADGSPGPTVYERHIASAVEEGGLTLLLPGRVTVDSLGQGDPLQTG